MGLKLSTFFHLLMKGLTRYFYEATFCFFLTSSTSSLRKGDRDINILPGSDWKRRNSHKIRHTCGPCFSFRLFAPVTDGIQQILASSVFKGVHLNVYLTRYQQDLDKGVLFTVTT